MENFIVIITVAFIIMFSPMIAKIFNISIAVVEIFLGIVAGFMGFLPSNLFLAILAKFGFLYLMFLAGLEMNLNLLKSIKKELSWNVKLYFLSLYFFSFLICLILQLSFVYFMTFSIFSLGMLVMLMKEYGKDEKWLNLALSIGVIGEIVSILALTIFSSWVEFGFGFGFYKSIFILVFVVMVCIAILKIFQIIFWWYPEMKQYIIPNIDKLDQDIRFSMSLLFILIAFMMYFDIELVLGAFVAGIFLKIYFHQKEELIEKLSSFGFGFFAPIFFIYVGSTIDVNIITLPVLLQSFFIIAVILIIRLISSFIAFGSYFDTKQTVLFSLSDSMPLTFMIAVGVLAYKHGIIVQTEYFSFIIASMIDGLVLMIVIRTLYNLFYKKNNP
ncbi:MAG: cation:proton antiporter [Campylobacterales bacterium]|nr:cation:proton antiporter [Campylobacterales bacterium]